MHAMGVVEALGWYVGMPSIACRVSSPNSRLHLGRSLWNCDRIIACRIVMMSPSSRSDWIPHLAMNSARLLLITDVSPGDEAGARAEYLG
jgi:hypothetical protein